jgi:hypothetical protein
MTALFKKAILNFRWFFGFQNSFFIDLIIMEVLD